MSDETLDEQVESPPNPDDSEATEAAVEAESTSSEPVTKFAVTDIVLVHFDIPSPSPTVFLQESEAPGRTLTFPIGLAEAQAIGLAITDQLSARPSTHELFSQALRETSVDVVALRITSNEGGVFRGELDLMGPRGRAVLDCRPSDGIVLALRQAPRAPILVDETLLNG